MLATLEVRRMVLVWWEKINVVIQKEQVVLNVGAASSRDS
jgi:hypothetical protein